MAGGRGTVIVEIAGAKRRLRVSLEAIDEIETRTGIGFPKIARSLQNEEKVRFGHLLVMYEELCKAGGRPLSADERSDLLPSDLPEILDGIREAAIEAGVIEEVDEDAGDSDGGAEGNAPTSSPGESGTE